MRHEFVEYAPDVLEEGVLYVSITLRNALHRCACGCGAEIATPLSPVGWEVRFDGETVSLYPSIGNWALPCQSHYWIRRDTVRWARRWSPAEVTRHRAREQALREDFAAGRLSADQLKRVGWDEDE